MSQNAAFGPYDGSRWIDARALVLCCEAAPL
jgi:hypothetical protein